MCGIAGAYCFSGKDGISFGYLIESMTQTLVHRGPDAYGSFIDQHVGIALGHRRLAIRDLTSTGAQPMESSCGRYVIVYNGEIYNHLEITADLEKNGRTLVGTSDTAVIVEAIAVWGIDKVLERLIGMFAFGVYDKQDKTLTLARDRLGIKPLYWGKVGGNYIFGSELKALRKAGFWQPVLNRNALASFMRHNYVPAPHTIYNDVFKLEPGQYINITPNSDHTIHTYWSLQNIAAQDKREILKENDDVLIQRLDDLLSKAVKDRMVTDVPIGALLSGGIDSSLVTALMAEQSNSKVSTFSIGFAEEEFNEAPYARQIANEIGTNHNELYAEPSHALDLVEHLPYWYDEPFADSSQIPTALVCELTKEHVTVVLSGDGGDELFAGYNRYPYGLDLWRNTNASPKTMRRALSKLLLSQSPNTYNAISRVIPRRLRINQLGDKVYKYANAMVENDFGDIYRRMISHWHEPSSLVLGSSEYKGKLWDRSVASDFPSVLDRMQFLDTVTYLPDDILTKVDRASMAFSLEARVPLLDHRFVELAWHMPPSMKIRNGITKWSLRQLLYRRIPKKLIDRPKMGFGIPLDKWLRGPLKDWANDLLSYERLSSQGLFNCDMITEKWEAHLKGENWSYPLWNILMFQAWLIANPSVKL